MHAQNPCACMQMSDRRVKMAPSIYSDPSFERCEIEEQSFVEEYVHNLNDLRKGIFNMGISVPVPFDAAMRALQFAAPFIKMFLAWWLLRLLRVRRHAVIVRGGGFFMHGGPDSLKDELVGFAGALYDHDHRDPTHGRQTETSAEASVARIWQCSRQFEFAARCRYLGARRNSNFKLDACRFRFEFAQIRIQIPTPRSAAGSASSFML